MLIPVFAALLVAQASPTQAQPTYGWTERYGTLQSLKALDCIEEWSQLCSPPAEMMQLLIQGDRVEITPWDGPGTFVFKVTEGDTQAVRLELSRCVELDRCVGKGKTAWLRKGPGNTATYEGPDIYKMVEGKIEVHAIALVSTATYNKLHEQLERQYVPGGRCRGLMGYQPHGGRTCINQPGDKRE